ncbi:hypothetical protein MBEHAL_1411 [Halarchaeum acidiphilum MH1-52-1]|uniref:Uncharacterized protein n=1 Tax=Halarchaeum acidiphilum MH1-52-1 TaxID=1261545 RepID=U2YF91_9EURY|nr:hypothetical protein MBEHAL_1411 [Halarchaeum acidiphilum MH1-52-1]
MAVSFDADWFAKRWRASFSHAGVGSVDPTAAYEMVASSEVLDVSMW